MIILMIFSFNIDAFVVTGLVVQEVWNGAGGVTGIAANDNHIRLPTELFTNSNRLPGMGNTTHNSFGLTSTLSLPLPLSLIVLVASFYFQDFSALLPRHK